MIKTVLTLVVLSVILIFLFAPYIFPFTTDSLIYISTAQNIREGNGLIFTNMFVMPIEPDLIPLRLYPPGYSFLMALLDWLGIDVYMAALLIPRFFFLLLPIAFFLVFHHMMSKRLSLVTAGLCSFMFPYVQCALMAWVDIPFLVMSLMSFFFAFKAIKTENKEQFLYCFLSGVFTGCSLLLRHVGYALLVSIGIGFILMIVFKIIPLKRSVKVILLYALGFFIVYMPYIIRNYLVFGMANSYRLPPSHFTLAENIANYSHTLAQMIFAYPFYDFILWILILGMFLWFITKIRYLMKINKKILLCMTILIIYFLSGSILVILAKTIYFGPEEINDRYLIQYAWVIVAGLSYSVYFLLFRLKIFQSIDRKNTTFLILLAFLLIQIFPAVNFYFKQKDTLSIAKKIKIYVPLLARLPQEYVIISNVMDLTYFFSRRNVRALNGYTPYGLSQLFGVKKKFAVFIVKERNYTSKSYLFPPSWHKPQGYRIVHSDRNVALWLPKITE